MELGVLILLMVLSVEAGVLAGYFFVGSGESRRRFLRTLARPETKSRLAVVLGLILVLLLAFITLQTMEMGVYQHLGMVTGQPSGNTVWTNLRDLAVLMAPLPVQVLAFFQSPYAGNPLLRSAVILITFLLAWLKLSPKIHEIVQIASRLLGRARRAVWRFREVVAGFLATP